MRRIIQRVVTVVTTTTWKISWETDPPRPSSPLGATPAEDTVPDDLPAPAIFQGTLPDMSAIETKEAHSPTDANLSDEQ